MRKAVPVPNRIPISAYNDPCAEMVALHSLLTNGKKQYTNANHGLSCIHTGSLSKIGPMDPELQWSNLCEWSLVVKQGA